MTKVNNKALFFIFLLTGGLISACLRYELSWDFLNYHYYNGFAFLNGRLGYDLAPGYQMTYNNPLLDALTYLIVTAFNAHISVYSFVLGLFFGGYLYSLFLLNSLFFDLNTSKGKVCLILSMIVGTTGFATWFQIGTSTGEIPVSALVLAGLYILIQHWFVKKNISQKHFLSAGFLLGAAAGLKLTATLYCLTSGFCVLCFFRTLSHPVRQISFFILGGLIGFLTFNGFWMIMLYNEFQNPVFPFFNAVFKSPWFPQINMRDQIHTIGQSPFSILMLPIMTIGHSNDFPVVGNCSFTDFRFLISFVLLIGLCCRLPFQPFSSIRNRTKFIILFSFSSYIAWVFMFSIIRYTVPIESVIGILFIQAGFYEKKHKLTLCLSSFAFLLLTATPLFSKPWDKIGDALINKQVSELNKVVPAFNVPELSEDALIFLMNSTTSGHFVPLAKKYPKARAISFFAPELLFMGTDGSITEYGKFKELKDKIIKEHAGDILAIFSLKQTYSENFLKKARKIINNADCFHPHLTTHSNNKKAIVETSSIYFCKIPKESVPLLNEKQNDITTQKALSNIYP